MKNVFDGIDIEKLSTEEATQLLIQIKAAQKALSGKCKLNYKKRDLLKKACEIQAIPFPNDAVYIFGRDIDKAVMHVADYCTGNFTDGDRHNAYVSHEIMIEYTNVLIEIISIIKRMRGEDNGSFHYE